MASLYATTEVAIIPSVNINGGTINATAEGKNGSAINIGYGSNKFTQIGGKVIATAKSEGGTGLNSSEGSTFEILGGDFTVAGEKGVNITGEGGSLKLGYSDYDNDEIKSSRFVAPTITIDDGKFFAAEDGEIYSGNVTDKFANGKNLLPFDKTKSVLLKLPDGVKITSDMTNIKQFGTSNNYICPKIGTVTLSASADGTYLYKIGENTSTDGNYTLTLSGDTDGKQTVTAEFLYTVTNNNENLTITAEKNVTSGEITYYGGKITVTPSAGYIVKDGLTDFTFSDGKYISNAAISSPTTINGTTTSGYTLKIVGNVTLSGDGVTKIGETNYYACEKNSTITATNFDGTDDTISIIDTGITLEQSGENIIAKSGGTTVLTISGLQFPTTTNSWSEFQNNSSTYSENISGGAKIDGAKISYQAASSETLFTLTGITKKPENNEVIIGNDGTVTLTSNVINMTATETYDLELTQTGNEYKLDLSNVNPTTTTVAATLQSGTYTSAYTLAHFDNNGNNKYLFQPATTAKTFNITNLNANAALGTNVIVTDGNTTNFKFKAAALDKKSVTISGGTFSVELDTDVDTTAETISVIKNLTGNMLSYSSSGTGEFYSATNSGVDYTPATKIDKFTLTGIKSADDVTVSEKTVTVNDADCTDIKITTTDNYTVVLGKNVTQSKTVAQKLDGNMFTFSGTTAGYISDDNGGYTWKNRVGCEKFTVTGITVAENYFSRNSNGKITLTLPADLIPAVNTTVSMVFNGFDDGSGNSITGTAPDYEIDYSAWQSNAVPAHWDNFVWVDDKTAATCTSNDNHSVNFTAATGGEELFKIDGLTVAPENPVKQASGGYEIKSLTGTNVTISESQTDVLNNSTIDAQNVTNLTANFSATVTTKSATVNGVSYTAADNGTLTIATTTTTSRLTSGTIIVIGEQLNVKVSDDSNGVKVNVTNENVDSITDLNSGGTVTYGGKTYTRTGDFISDGTNHYAATDTTNLLALGAATNYVEVTDTIDLRNVTAKTIFGVNGTQVATYDSGALTIDSGSYKVLTSGGVTIGGTTYNATTALEFQATKDNSTLTSGTVNGIQTLTTTSNKNFSVNNDTDGVTVTVANSEVTAVTNLADGGTVTYDGKTFLHTLTTAATVTRNEGDELSVNGAPRYTSGTTLTVGNFTGGEISFDDTITELTKSGENIIAKSNGVDALTIGGLTFSTSSNGWTTVGNGTATYSENFTSGAEISDTKIIYQSTSSNNLFTIDNLNSAATLEQVKAAVSVDGYEITFTAETVLDQNKIISAPDNYTFKLGGNVTQSETKGLSWETINAANGEYKYIAAGDTAGYKISNNKISYVTDTRDTFTITGVKSTDEISVSGKTVTVPSTALDNKTVTVSAGYNLVLSGVTAPEEISAGWATSGNDFVYQTAYVKTAGYKSDGTYISATTPTELFALSNSSATLNELNLSGVSVTNNAGKYTVELSAAALPTGTFADGMTITLTQKNNTDCTLKLATGIDKTQTKKSAATLVNGTYTSETFKAWYDDSTANQIACHPETTAKIFTVTNLNANAALGTNVIVTDGDTTNFKFKAAALDKKSLTISGENFSVELDDDVDTTAETINETMKFLGNTMTYLAAGVGEYYEKTESGVTYHEATGNELFKIEGLSAEPGNPVKQASGGYEIKLLTGTDVTISETQKDVLNNSTIDAQNVTNLTANFSATVTTKSATVNGISYTAADNSTLTIATTAETSTLTSGKVTVMPENPLPLTGGNKIFVSSGSVKISVENGTKLTVENFTGGEISFGDTITELTKSGGNIIAKSNGVDALTIGGLNSPSSSNGWSVRGDSATYSQNFTGGAEISATKIIYRAGSTNKNFTLNNLKDNVTLAEVRSAINLSGKNITFKSDSILDKNKIVSAPAGYTLKLGDDVQRVEKISSGWNGNIYTAEGTTAGYSIDDGKIIYSDQIGGESFSVDGATDKSGIKIDGKSVTIDDSSLNKNSVTFTNLNDADFNFALDDDVQRVEKISSGWSGNIYTAEGFTAGYSIDDGKIIYSDQIGGEQFSVDGITDKSGIDVDGKSVTIGDSSLNKNSVTFTNLNGADFNFALDDDVQRVEKISAGWNDNIYTTEGFTAGYSIDDGKIIYSDQIGGEQFSVDGVTDKSGIKIDGKSVTIGDSSLNKNPVTFKNIDGADFNFALNDDVQRVEKISSGWNGNIYTAEGFTAGYSIDDGKIIYSDQIGGEQFSVDGITDKSGIKIDGKSVTIGDSSLNKNSVTFTNLNGADFIFALGDDVARLEKISSGWNGNIYTAEGFTAGYLIDDGKIIYSEQIGGESFTISGIKSTDGVTVDGKKITVNRNNVISGQEVTITPADIYALELVGEISNEDDNSDEYDESDRTDPARLIREIIGIDIHKLDKIDGNHDDFDEIISEKIVQLNFSEGDGVQEINLSNSEYPQVVSLEGGKQNLDFDFDDINIAVVDKTADGRKAIEFSNNRSLGIFRSADAKTNVTLGTDSDSLFVDRNARVRVDMSNGGNAKIVPYSGTVTLENYDAATGSVIVVPYVENIVAAVKNNSIKLVSNVMRLGSGDSKATVKFNDEDENSTLVNLITESGAVQKVGFTGNFGGTLDTSELQGDFLLKGNYAETSSAKQKRKGSTITAGEGDDTLLAGARDVIDGGDGNNQIYLTPPELRQNKSGATIILGGKGRNTVYGFGGGLAYDDDCVKVDNFSDIDFKFDSDGLLLTSGDARLKFDGGSVETSEKILITDGSSTLRAVIAKPEQTVTITNDNDGLPTAFFGKNSGLNFSEFNGNVNINLAEGSGFLNGRAAIFDGINELQAGDGFCTLIGSENSETLTAGNGYGTIGGGKGNDKIIGKGGSPDKNGRTEFLFGAGDGRDTISGFEFLTPENRFAGIDDRIEVGNSDINNAYCSGNDVVIEFDDNSELIVEGAVGKDFRIADMIAKVDKNIAFDGIANCYVADGGTELVVDSTVESAEIWLDNSHGTKFYGNIFTLDASAVAGNTSLVGNQFDNTIIAGQGDSSLWGGYGNDLLIGGSSRNTFFYLFGNGNDTIQGAGDGDEIILADIFREQIAEIYTDADFVAVRFTDGGSLQINGNTEINCVLADGSKLAYRD